MERKEEICRIVKRYYNDSNKESLEVLESKYLDMFLNTNLSLDEIEKKVKKALESKERPKDNSYMFYIIALGVFLAIIIAIFALIKNVVK